MAENLLPEVIPGMVAVQYVGADDKDSGEKKGSVNNVFPIDAKDLVATGSYKLVDNGSVEAARLNANPLRAAQAAAPEVVVAEVTGVGGQVHVAEDAKAAEAAKKASDSADAKPAAGAPAAKPAGK